MRKMIFSSILALVLGVAQVPVAWGISIGFSPSWNGSITSGSNYSVDVIVSGLPAGQIVSAYDLDLRYNTAFLNVNSFAFGSWLGNPGLVLQDFDYTTTPGTIDFAAVSFLSDASLLALQSPLGGAVTLATMNFTATGTGNTYMYFDWYPGQDIKGAVNTVILDSSPVPEPSTIVLLGAGLGLMALFRKRKGSRSRTMDHSASAESDNTLH